MSDNKFEGTGAWPQPGAGASAGPFLPPEFAPQFHSPLTDEQAQRALVVAELSRRCDPDRLPTYVLEWADYILTGARVIEAEVLEAPAATLQEIGEATAYVIDQIADRRHQFLRTDIETHATAQRIAAHLLGAEG